MDHGVAFAQGLSVDWQHPLAQLKKVESADKSRDEAIGHAPNPVTASHLMLKMLKNVPT